MGEDVRMMPMRRQWSMLTILRVGIELDIYLTKYSARSVFIDLGIPVSFGLMATDLLAVTAQGLPLRCVCVCARARVCSPPSPPTPSAHHRLAFATLRLPEKIVYSSFESNYVKRHVTPHMYGFGFHRHSVCCLPSGVAIRRRVRVCMRLFPFAIIVNTLGRA